MKSQRPFWLIALLALVFIGQSLTVAAMPCQFMDATPINMSHEQMNHPMDHSMMDMHHDMSHMDDVQNQPGDMKTTHDCCKTLGHCPSGNCSAPTMSYNLILKLPSNKPLIASGYHQRIPNSPVSSLYRPPIFA
jgi:hypothetical protein